MKFICANADLIQGVNLDTDYDYITAKSKSITLAVESLANSFAKSKSDCVLFVWNSDDPYDLVRATEQASLEDVDFGKIIDELKNNLDYSVLGDFDLESIELENGFMISVVKYVTMNNLKESKKSTRKSLKESDDNWYKLKMLNEILDLMAEDEYNIPKLTIYGKTKWIDLDEGAIKTLIKYYK